MANLSTTTDLTINILSQEKYDQLKTNNQLNSYQLYFTDNVFLDAENNRVVNVASPVVSSDAATKMYVDTAVSSIVVPVDLSAFTNSPGYISSVDATLSIAGAAADAKAVGGALRSGFTEWVCDEIDAGYEFISCDWVKAQGMTDYAWRATLASTVSPLPITQYIVFGNAPYEAVALSNSQIQLSRHLITPTKTSQLSNDSGFLSAVPDSYKTYNTTVSSLSSNGYALQSQVSSKTDTSAVVLLSANQTQVIDLGGQSQITLNYADHYIQVTGYDNGIEFNEGTYNTFQNGAFIELTDVSSYIIMSNPTCLRFADSYNNLSDLLSSNYQPKGDYLSSNALNDYYSKSQTSSAAEISDAFNAKSSIVIKTANVSSSLSTLVVNNVTQQEYIALSAAGQTVSSELYIIDPDSVNLDARGDWVTNVKTPELSSDAANKAYVDEQLSNAGGGFSFEIYYPPYNSAAQTYVLKPGKFNILSSRVKNNDNIILEDYTVDQVYKVQLTGNATTAVSVNLLVDTNAGDVLPGAYSDSSIASCLTKIARGEVYNFEVSYGNVTFDNDFNGDSLRTLNPYGINPIYGGGYEKYELMPLNNACNHLSIAASNSEYDNMQFDLAIPCRVRTNQVRRMRQFSISFKTEFSERGMSLNFPSTDINGSSLSWQFICGWQYAKAPKRGDVLTFTEYQKDVLLVDIQNVNQTLWYSFVTPTPLSGVVTMKDRCVNYVNITTTANSYWEWSDGENRAPPYYNETLNPPQWTNGGGNYDIINFDAGPSETMLYIYPDPNDHDESTIVVGQFVTTYAINSGNGTIAMPPAIPGKCRDFLLRLRIDASNVPNITFTGGNFETESGQFPVLEEGVQVLSFTEVKTNTFMLGCKKMTVAS